jgi:hypothetical protein
MQNQQRGSRRFRLLALGLAVALLAAPAAQARSDNGMPALPGRTLVGHPVSRAQPSWPGVNPHTSPSEDSAAAVVVVSKPDEGLLAWGPQEMALAGALVAATLLGAGLLFTMREGRRMLQSASAPRSEATWPWNSLRPTPAHPSRSPREALS